MNNLAHMRNEASSFSTINRENHSEPLISVIIPAYNEEKALDDVIRRTKKVFQDLNTLYEIMVVDDGSTDRTCHVANLKDVVVIRNHKNHGKGHALRTGFNRCNGNIIVTMDADGSNQPEELPHLLRPILKNEFKVVVGSRFKGSVEEGAIQKTHLIGNRIFNFLIFLLLRKWLTDTQSGFRAIEKNVLLNLNLRSMGYNIESEMTVELIKKGFEISEVPISCSKPVGNVSRIKAFQDGCKILGTIFETFFRKPKQDVFK